MFFDLYFCIFPAHFSYRTFLRYSTVHERLRSIELWAALPVQFYASMTVLKVPENIDRIYIFYRFHRYSQGLLGSSTMGKLDQLRSTLSLWIKRLYFLDRWIGVESLLSILHNQYNLHHINKFYVNRFINNIGLINDINIFHHKEEYLFGKHNSRRFFFVIFTAKTECPKKLSKEELKNVIMSSVSYVQIK